VKQERAAAAQSSGIAVCGGEMPPLLIAVISWPRAGSPMLQKVAAKHAIGIRSRKFEDGIELEHDFDHRNGDDG